jgi:hypothetical protein
VKKKMQAKSLISLTYKIKNENLKTSYDILRQANKVSCSFLNIYTKNRGVRIEKTSSTDDEQDLLRAMLVFATAGLDSMMKQLVKDALEKVIDNNPGALQQLESFALQKLKKGSILDLPAEVTSYKFLSLLITTDSPKKALIAKLIDELRSGSLQSADELLKVANYFAISPEALKLNTKKLKDVFKVRNKIIHEMDITLEKPNRKRTQRNCSDMIQNTNFILKTAENFIKCVDEMYNYS